MVAKKSTKPRKRPAARPKDWRETIGTRLSKVPEVDAVFVSTGKGTVHVYSVVEDLKGDFYDQLLKEESLIEKKFPEIGFEFHTSAHQGRKPKRTEQGSSALVFLRDE